MTEDVRALSSAPKAEKDLVSVELPAIFATRATRLPELHELPLLTRLTAEDAGSQVVAVTVGAVADRRFFVFKFPFAVIAVAGLFVSVPRIVVVVVVATIRPTEV